MGFASTTVTRVGENHQRREEGRLGGGWENLPSCDRPIRRYLLESFIRAVHAWKKEANKCPPWWDIP